LFEPTNKTRVLFILPSLKRAGAEIQTIDLVNGLSNEKFEKHLLCFEKGTDLLDKIDRNSVIFHHVPRSAKFDWALAGQISAIIDRHAIQAVHCSLLIALFWGWFAVRRAKNKPPLIAAIHTTTNRSRRADLFDLFVYQWLLRGCSKVVFVCEAQKKYWERRFPFLMFKSVCIHNGIDIDWFKKDVVAEDAVIMKKKMGLPVDSKVIANIAAFRPEKGHLILLEAFKRLRADIKEAHLVMAGDGPLREVVARKIAEWDLTDCVHLPGSLTDVRPLLANSSISVLASTAVETFSIAMLESLAMKVPVIATNLGGASEAVIPGMTGYLVQPNDVDSLVAALNKCINDDENNKLGQQGRQRVKQFFTRNIMLDKYTTLLTDATKRGRL